MGVPGQRRTRPIADEILDALRDGTWVQNSELAQRCGALDVKAMASTISRLRSEGVEIESGTFYRLATDPLDFEDPLTPTRGAKRQSDARAIRGATPLGDQLHIADTFWKQIGAPRSLAMKYDRKQGVIGLRTGAGEGAHVRTRADGRRHIEITLPGLFDTLDVPAPVTRLQFDCRVRDGFLLLRACTPYTRCEHCDGKGVV